MNGVENCTATVEISGMQELTSQLDMGLTVQISGNDIDTMTALSEKVVDMVNENGPALPMQPTVWAAAMPPSTCRSTGIRSAPTA